MSTGKVDGVVAREGDDSDKDNRQELAWRQYALFADLYRFYIETAGKAFALYYAITGALLSFYFTHTEVRLARWGLALPLALSLALAPLLWRGAARVDDLTAAAELLRRDLALAARPDFSLLPFLLRCLSVVLVITAAALAVVFAGAPR